MSSANVSISRKDVDEGPGVNIHRMRSPASVLLLAAGAAGGTGAAQQPPPPLVAVGYVRPIAPPARLLPSESASARVTRFSFIAYGDTRCDCRLPNSDARVSFPAAPEVQDEHRRVVDAVLAKVTALAATPFPARFVVQSGDAAYRGPDAQRWNDVFTPIVERLTRGAGLPFFFVPGNHDVTQTPVGDPQHAIGLNNTLSAISKLIPPEGSPRRLNGYATYSFGYGNAFFIGLDSNIASDPVQLAWVADQLEHLDRSRYHHVMAFFHHPPFTSGRYSGAPTTNTLPGGLSAGGGVAPQALAIRNLYLPLFHKHHVRMIIAGHDHLYDHWVEHFTDNGVTYRMDDIVSGGGGAPAYVYTGEPDLHEYLAAGAARQVTLEHLAKPSATQAENPHHFFVIQVDGDRLSLEVIGTGPTAFAPYGGKSRIDLQ
jgi:hypothetical protein